MLGPYCLPGLALCSPILSWNSLNSVLTCTLNKLRKWGNSLIMWSTWVGILSWTVFLQNLYVEVLTFSTQSVTLSGDKILTGVIRIGLFWGSWTKFQPWGGGAILQTLRIPAGCPTTQLNSDTICWRYGPISQVKGSVLRICSSPTSVSHKSSLSLCFWLTSYTWGLPQAPLEISDAMPKSRLLPVPLSSCL